MPQRMEQMDPYIGPCLNGPAILMFHSRRRWPRWVFNLIVTVCMLLARYAIAISLLNQNGGNNLGVWNANHSIHPVQASRSSSATVRITVFCRFHIFHWESFIGILWPNQVQNKPTCDDKRHGDSHSFWTRYDHRRIDCSRRGISPRWYYLADALQEGSCLVCWYSDITLRSCQPIDNSIGAFQTPQLLEVSGMWWLLEWQNFIA